MLVHAINNAACEFASDVRAGLARDGQKELPSKYLYDDLGSALFEVISRLPEYGLTRADERLLRSHADEIVARLDAPSPSPNWAVEAARRRDIYWRHLAAGSAHFIIRLKFLAQPWPCASVNSAISIPSAL